MGGGEGVEAGPHDFSRAGGDWCLPRNANDTAPVRQDDCRSDLGAAQVERENGSCGQREPSATDRETGVILANGLPAPAGAR